MRHLFLDVDGVFADFDQHVKDLFGALPNELGDEQMWALVDQTPSFWTGMPLTPWAMQLWSEVKDYQPTFLTGCPKSNFDLAATHKRHWLAEQFGEKFPVITCLSRNKQLHMKKPGDVLVDDRHSNIRRWQKAGGQSVLFKKHDEAISLVHEAMASTP